MVQGQLDFKPKRGRTIPPVEIAAGLVPPEDADRLTGQNAQVFQRLKNGPATNAELAQIGLKYTSRVSDVRKFVRKYFEGWDVVCIKGAGGLNTYELKRN